MASAFGFQNKLKLEVFMSINLIMETKLCGCCNVMKLVNEFHSNPTKKDGCQSMCKECRKVYHRKHYEKNIDKYKDKAKKYKKTNIDWFINIKKNLVCEKCGEDRYWVLDFHHLNSDDKDRDISKMIRSSSIEKIMDEMNKCIILCSNCHRDLHYNEKCDSRIVVDCTSLPS